VRAAVLAAALLALGGCAAEPQSPPAGELPPGISIVSFAGGESRCLRGPAGEILELVAAP